MKKLEKTQDLQKRPLPQLSRGMWELIVLLVIVVFALSVFTVTLRSRGTLTYNSSTGALTYKGTIVNHRMNGQGLLTYPNGDSYEGQLTNGVFNGQGTFKASSGWSYTGEFKNGKPDGKGTLTAKDGTVYKGEFKQGIYQK
ncbi:MORN repeat-containing protein [Streptococcus sp. zg-JUN1979]|uniref:MORN repeat-containing protein n=1 Tax=Streptococcus sp. zg-JUN1979 TaxID=3391450 RepID=UPI0039A61D33